MKNDSTMLLADGFGDNLFQTEAAALMQKQLRPMIDCKKEFPSQSVDDEQNSSQNRRRRRPRLSPLPFLTASESWRHPLSFPRPGGNSRNFEDNKKTFKPPENLPILPETTLVEILGFCDPPTLLAVRGVSRSFRDLEIPREFHHRVMSKLHFGANGRKNQVFPPLRDNESRKNQERARRGVQYSYKNKIVDHEDRKVWIFLRNIENDSKNENNKNNEKDEDDTNIVHPIQPFNCLYNVPQHWSSKIVTAKVLKLIREIEFYKGVISGYDEDKAEALLLQKGCIDDGDFPQPSLSFSESVQKRLGWRKHQRRSGSQRKFPVYGKWRAEASVRPLPLDEALKILSVQGPRTENFDKQQIFWWRRSQDTEKQKRSTAQTRSGENGTATGLSLLLSAAGVSSPPESPTGIFLAEYSTVFDQTRMACSVLLFRTHGGAEAEVRILSGRIEPDASRSWKHPWRSNGREKR